MKFWIPLVYLATVLVGCGGGDGDETPVGTQQYPGGIWEGTVGTSTAQRTAIGYIDPGIDGKGGAFFLARGAAGATAYDAIYGVLRADKMVVQATGATYFSVQDGKFASGIAVRGTASADPVTARTSAISGNYSNPAATAAATGMATPFKLAYSSLNNYAATSALIAGTYRGSGTFGTGSWVLTVSSQGLVSGRIGGCTINSADNPNGPGSSAAPRSGESPLYGLNLNMSGNTLDCPVTGTQQTGVAFLCFDSTGVPSGIFAFITNATGTPNVYVLEGRADPRTVTTPSPTPLSVAGSWLGSLTFPAGVIGDSSVYGTVLPDGGMFFYTNSSFDYNLLYGRLIRYNNDATTNRFVTANDGVYFDRLLGGTATGQYIVNVLVDGTLESAAGSGQATRFSGTYSYPAQPGGEPTAFTMVPDPLYALPSGAVPNLALITGVYQMAGKAFGDHTSTLTLWADGAITGVTSNNCLIVGKVLGELGSGLNLYRVEAFSYLADPSTPATFITCDLKDGPSESGTASAQFDNAGNVIGLRILTAGVSGNNEQVGTSRRAHTVFDGRRQ